MLRARRGRFVVGTAVRAVATRAEGYRVPLIASLSPNKQSK
jgi:hypothetical protein